MSEKLESGEANTPQEKLLMQQTVVHFHSAYMQAREAGLNATQTLNCIAQVIGMIYASMYRLELSKIFKCHENISKAIMHYVGHWNAELDKQDMADSRRRGKPS